MNEGMALLCSMLRKTILRIGRIYIMSPPIKRGERRRESEAYVYIDRYRNEYQGICKSKSLSSVTKELKEVPIYQAGRQVNGGM